MLSLIFRLAKYQAFLTGQGRGDFRGGRVKERGEAVSPFRFVLLP